MIKAEKLDQALFAVLMAGVIRKDAEFNEADHPRAADGKFGSGGPKVDVYFSLVAAEDKGGPSAVKEAAKQIYDKDPALADRINSEMRDLGYASDFKAPEAREAGNPSEMEPEIDSPVVDTGDFEVINREGLYHRRTRGAVDNGVGYMMYSADGDRLSPYGKNHYTADLADIPKREVIDADSAIFRKKIRAALKKAKQDDPNLDVASLVELVNPDDIVDSAGIWDNTDLVSVLYEKVLEPNGWTVVKTKDGIISFDPTHARHLGRHDSAGGNKPRQNDVLDTAKLDSVLYEVMQAAGTSALPEPVPALYEPTVDVAPVRAAGVMIVTGVSPDDRVLLLQRSREGDHALEWCFPGGKVEDGETALQAAGREVLEETGLTIGRTIEWTRQVLDGVDFTTFLAVASGGWAVTLNPEHVSFCWAILSAPPQPLHPGCAVALARHAMDELAVAEAIRDGQLVSPQRYGNLWLFAIRVTGTGFAYREAQKESCYRPPSEYLDERFLRRCAGLPVLWDHTDGPKLDSEEYRGRNVGSVFFAYVRGDEVWAVARIYDDLCVRWLMADDRSTSPGVVFAAVNDNQTCRRDDGTTLLVEAAPKLMDHVALCDVGVWDRGGAPKGVETVKEEAHGE